MTKYLAIFNISWQNMLVYRLNFILWRFRTVLQLFLVFFVWWSVFQNQKEVFGYTEESILTYVLAAALVRAIVLSSRIMDIAGHINEGGVVNFLVKPVDFIGFYFTRDLADKFLNISFVIAELSLVIFILKPPLILQKNLTTLSLFLISIILAVFLYFSLSFMFGLLAFWLENIWGIYFLFFMIIEAFGGGLFPIDILPSPFAQILLLTPFPYLLYFPAKIYMGVLSNFELLAGFSVLSLWVFVGWFLMKKVLDTGLKTYTAVGH